MLVQLTGNATIIGSKALSDEEKAKVLSAAEGKRKVVRLHLVDAQGNETVLEGRLYESKSGSLTARIMLQSEDCKVVEVATKAAKDDSTDLREELGL